MPPIQSNDRDTPLYRRVLFQQHVDPVQTYDEAHYLLRADPNDPRALQFMGWYALLAHDDISSFRWLEKSLIGGEYKFFESGQSVI